MLNAPFPDSSMRNSDHDREPDTSQAVANVSPYYTRLSSNLICPPRRDLILEQQFSAIQSLIQSNSEQNSHAPTIKNSTDSNVSFSPLITSQFPNISSSQNNSLEHATN